VLKKRIKDIAKDSSIYGLSKLIGQAIGFFLIPLYTKYLSPEDYGVLNIIGVASVSFGLLMTFGIDSATYRFAGLAKTEEEEKKYLSAAQSMNLFFVVVVGLLLLLSTNFTTKVILENSSPNILLIIGIFVSIFSSISSINRAFFRIKRKVKIISIASILNIISSIVSTILLVVILELGVVGALLGNLIGNLLSSGYLMFKSSSITKFDINWITVKQLLTYSLPVLPAQLFAFAIPLYSQWSVKEYLSMSDLGMYAIGLKFTIPVTLLLGMFQQAYGPYKFEILKTDKNPKDVFQKIMSLYIMFFGLLVLVVAFFGGYILMWMTPLNFHSAEDYLFYIALIPFFQGLYFMFSTGSEISQTQWYRPFISAAGLLVVLLSNHYLIKKFGVIGASMAISLSWLVMALGNMIYSALLYPISYNWTLIISFTSLMLLAGYYVNRYEPSFLYRVLIILGILVIVYFSVKKNHKLLTKLILKK
jgi:O-antigen/teichoic acid export membrane protein